MRMRIVFNDHLPLKIMLNDRLPSAKQRLLLGAMGFDVSNIENQRDGRYYFLEAWDPAFKQRIENAGIRRTKKTISFYGVDVMCVTTCTLFNGKAIQFELDKEGVKNALEKQKLVASFEASLQKEFEGYRFTS